MRNVFLVIPTIRSVDFLMAWKNQLSDVTIIVVEDADDTSVRIPVGVGKRVYHYSRRDIARDLGKYEWIVGRRNSSIRNYGFLKAYEKGADFILTMDDDCYPTADRLVEGHLDNLAFRVHDSVWMPTYPGGQWMYTRGFPYGLRNRADVWVSHGLWSGALDLDGKTEVANGTLLNEKAYQDIRQAVPRGVYYPMCSMNLAFVREATPVMFFPMMGEDPTGAGWGYDRFDDIWAGVLSKKVLDHLGYGVVNGSPFVEHRKKSIPTHNLSKEEVGMKVNEQFWQWVDAVTLTGTSLKECYVELAEKANFPDKEYFERLREAMKIWAGLFD